MRAVFADKVEAGRIRSGDFASAPGEPFGAFEFMGPCGAKLAVIASAGDLIISRGWQHVSVSLARRLPNWLEMCHAKDLFFDDEECVVQFHPPRSVYVNIHPHCLHLWKPPFAIELPPQVCV